MALPVSMDFGLQYSKAEEESEIMPSPRIMVSNCVELKASSLITLTVSGMTISTSPDDANALYPIDCKPSFNTASVSALQ